MNTLSTTYKEEAIEAAKDLLYDKKYIEQLEQATSDREIEHIMVNARHEKFDKKKR